MQASLCLRTTGPSARIQHSRLALCQAGSAFLQRPSQITLNFSPFFCTGLRARPSRRPFSLAVRAHKTPPEDGIDKKKDEQARRGTVKLVAAAVVLACTLGATYANRKARADDGGRFPWHLTRSTATGDGLPPPPPSIPGSEDIETKSKKALREVLEQKFAPGTQKPAPAVPKILVELLDVALPPREISLVEYNVGLVLIDLLILQGDYNRAEEVLKKVEPVAPPQDSRVRIRRDVLKILLEDKGSETARKKMQSKVQEFIEKELKKN